MLNDEKVLRGRPGAVMKRVLARDFEIVRDGLLATENEGSRKRRERKGKQADGELHTCCERDQGRECRCR
jgi:hypothetical protein